MPRQSGQQMCILYNIIHCARTEGLGISHGRAQPTTADQPSTAEHRRAQPSTADHSRAQPSTAEHSRAQPTTADYGRAPEHSRAADTADYSRLRRTTAEHPSTAEQPTTADHKRKINRRVAELAKLPDCCHGTHVVTLRPFRQWDYRHFSGSTTSSPALKPPKGDSEAIVF